VFWVQVIISGVALGSIYALAGLGLVLTYKATGIFNFAHGAIAMIVAYSLWEARERWHFPLWLAGIFAVVVVGPGIGLVLERVVFRPLQRRRASTSEKLVATLGVFLVCLGAAYEIWTGEIRQEPRLITNKAIHLPGKLVIGTDQLATVILVIAVSAGLWALFRFTAVGTDIKAVVDRRELAELSSINADRVAGLSWALGCGLAGLTGVLLAAQEGLDPFHLTLLVIETFSIAVVAGLTSLPIAVAAGILILGVGNALLLQFRPHVLPIFHTHLPNAIANGIDQLKPNLSVIVLFVALVALRNLDEPSDEGAGRNRLIARRASGARSRTSSTVLVAAGGVIALLLPLSVGAVGLERAQVTLALVVIFTSIVCITGYCGYITLGQAGFAGIGAFMSARAAVWWHFPVPLALVAGGVAGMVLGLIAGYPALKRRGLFLGLTTLSIGLLAYNFVFTNDFFKPDSVAVNRPSFATGQRAFYWYELACVVVVLILARNLRSGRLGRVLGAMGDSEVAAQAVGISLRRFKLFVFAISAFIAGVGGALLAEQAQVFSGLSFDPINASLEWFAVMIVAGVGSLEGAVLGAFVFELLNVFLPGQNTGILVIALGALFIGYLPGGSLTGIIQWVFERVRTPRGLQREFARAQSDLADRSTLVAPDLEPSSFARQILSEPSILEPVRR
jgi:branched-chain amino acid transport system permease protein